MPNSINIFIINIPIKDLHKNVVSPTESKFLVLSSFLYWLLSMTSVGSLNVTKLICSQMIINRLEPSQM